MNPSKPLAITSWNNSFIHSDSEFYIHTATSCYQIETVFIKFTDSNFEEGMEKAQLIRDAINEKLFKNWKPELNPLP